MTTTDKTIQPNIPLSPYRKAASLIKHRLSYDLTPATWKNRKKLKALKNKYAGKKSVILCNGPSLNAVDFDELSQHKEVFTIGLNKINLMFDKNNFRPDCIVCVNPFVIEQNIDFYLSTDITLFLDSYGLKRIGKLSEAARRPNVYLLHSTDILGAFATDISLSISQGFTVTYVATQVAFHLGFTHVSLVGCDHTFASKGMANKTIKQEGTEKNHFIDNYFAPGSTWELPDLLGSEYHYQVARDTYIINNRTVYNSTSGGELEIFPRLPLQEFYAIDDHN